MRLGSAQLRKGILRYACRCSDSPIPARMYRNRLTGDSLFLGSHRKDCRELGFSDEVIQPLGRSEVARRLRLWRRGTLLMPERTEYRSLLPLDVGFDLRGTNLVVRIYQGFSYWYLDRENRKAFAGVEAGLEAVAEALARSGYRVVPFKTSTGEDVMVLLDSLSEGGILWYVGTGNSRFWSQGTTLPDAVSKSNQSPGEIQPLSSDEYL